MNPVSNYSTAVFLINKNVRCVLVTYQTDEDPEFKGTNRKPKREPFKTFDKAIKVGDYAVVPTDTRHCMTVVKVVEVDVPVDFDNPTQMNWIVGTVHRDDFDVTRSREDQAIKAIQRAQAKRREDELRKTMLADYEDEILKLPIAKIDGKAEELVPQQPPHRS